MARVEFAQRGGHGVGAFGTGEEIGDHEDHRAAFQRAAQAVHRRREGGAARDGLEFEHVADEAEHVAAALLRTHPEFFPVGEEQEPDLVAGLDQGGGAMIGGDGLSVGGMGEVDGHLCLEVQG